MDLSLDNNVNKLVLLIVCGCIVLIVINLLKKSIGKQLSVLMSLIVIVVVGYFGYVLLNDTSENYNNFNASPVENFEDDDSPLNVEYFDNHEDNGNGNANVNGNVVENSVLVNNEVSGVYKNEVQNNAELKNNDELNCLQLLPSDTNSDFSQNNPNTPGDICVKNLLNSGHHIGVNTQGCSLRNANRGLRSEPPNPQVQVSPWLQTTICPDLHRKPLDGSV
jgi:hypothetical protein